MKLSAQLKGLFVVTLLVVFTSLVACGEGERIPSKLISKKYFHLPETGEYQNPETMGRYQVGVTTKLYIDYDIYEWWGDSFRTLRTEIWYPTQDTEGPLNTIRDYAGTDNPEWLWGLVQILYGDKMDMFDTPTDSFRDAKPIEEGSFPMVIFSHGLSGIRFQNYSFCERLASHGFIVVAPDHYGNAIFSDIGNGKVVIFDPITIVTGITQHPRDVTFLIDSLIDEAKDDDPIASRIDFGRIGISGHSYGGMTSLYSAQMDHRIHSVGAMNAPYFSQLPDWYNVPTFYIMGGSDGMVAFFIGSNEPVRRLYASQKGTRWYIEIRKAGHYSVTDVCDLFPDWYPVDEGCKSDKFINNDLAIQIASSYLTAFFHYTLYWDHRYLDQYLLDNQFPEYINLQHRDDGTNPIP